MVVSPSRMVLPPLRWAYRRAARRSLTILTVSLVTLGLVLVRQAGLQLERYEELSDAPYGPAEERVPAAAACVGCSPWDEAGAVEALAVPEVVGRLAAELSEAGLSTHCGRLAFPGGQPVCLDTDLLPPTGPCLIYSAARSANLQFEADMVRRLGCEVHLFTPAGVQLTPAQLPPNVTHHRVGGAAAAAGRRLPTGTLDELASALGRQPRDIHYLRLDAGGSEWAALRRQLTGGAADPLGRVRQLNVAFHLSTAPDTLDGNAGELRRLDVEDARRPDGEDARRLDGEDTRRLDGEDARRLDGEDARRFLRTLAALRTAGLRLAYVHPWKSSSPPEVGLAQTYTTLWVRWEEPPCTVNKTRGGLMCCEYGRVRCDVG